MVTHSDWSKRVLFTGTEEQMVSKKHSNCLYHSQFLTASHKIGQDISIISLIGSYSKLKKKWGVRKCSQEWKRDRRLPEAMEIQPLSISQTLCHFHIFKWLRLFLDFSTLIGTQNNTYIAFCFLHLQLAKFPQLPYVSATFPSTHHFTCAWINSVTLTMEEI